MNLLYWWKQVLEIFNPIEESHVVARSKFFARKIFCLCRFHEISRNESRVYSSLLDQFLQNFKVHNLLKSDYIESWRKTTVISLLSRYHWNCIQVKEGITEWPWFWRPLWFWLEFFLLVISPCIVNIQK